MTSRTVRSFQVKIPPSVWKCLGPVPARDFQALQDALEEVALLLGVVGAPRAARLRALNQSRLSLVVGDFVALYSVDEELQTVTLQNVARLLGHEDTAPGRGALLG